MKKLAAEFKKFITRGNIMDMSVGIIVGGAFTAIVTSLSNNILKPIINWILAICIGSSDLSGIYTYLKKVVVDGKVDLAQSIYIDWGAFINAIINFLLIALVLFILLKLFNQVKESSTKLLDRKEHILYKKEKGLKITKREEKFLKETLEREAKELEEKKRKEEEEKNKLTKSEALLTEIRDLMAKDNSK